MSGIRLNSFRAGQQQLAIDYDNVAKVVNSPERYPIWKSGLPKGNVYEAKDIINQQFEKLWQCCSNPNTLAAWQETELYAALQEEPYQYKRFAAPLQTEFLEQKQRKLNLLRCCNGLLTPKNIGIRLKVEQKTKTAAHYYYFHYVAWEENTISNTFELPSYEMKLNPKEIGTIYNTVIWQRIFLVNLPSELKLRIKVFYRTCADDNPYFPFKALGMFAAPDTTYLLADMVKEVGVTELELPPPWSTAAAEQTYTENFSNKAQAQYIQFEILTP